MTEPNTPECDKLLAVSEKSQLCGEFYEWLQERFHILQKVPPSIRDNVPYLPPQENLERLLADFFEIDLDRVEKERREILAHINRVR